MEEEDAVMEVTQHELFEDTFDHACYCAVTQKRRQLLPWSGQLERVWAPKIDPKGGKTGQNQPKLKISEKIINHVFCVKMANFT